MIGAAAWSDWLPVLPSTAFAAWYGSAVERLRRRGDQWPLIRTAAAAGGYGALLASIFLPGLAMGFSVHAVQHVLLAMLAPLCLALSAPITLAFRTLPRYGRSRLRSAVGSRLAGSLLSAPVVLVLDVGAMYLYFLTPLYAAAEHRAWLHALVHLHMFLAGCLLSWYLVGRDPMPARASEFPRMLVLLTAAGSHDLLAKLMYAHLRPAGGGPPDQLRLGAQILFYGGDVVEVALAVAMLSSWYARTGRALARESRRPESRRRP